MEVKIGSKYRITSTAPKSVISIEVTLAHVFPANVKPDETLMRVYAAGPAGEPPPESVYKPNFKERWVFKKHGRNYREFMVVAIPMYYHTIEEIHGNP